MRRAADIAEQAALPALFLEDARDALPLQHTFSKVSADAGSTGPSMLLRAVRPMRSCMELCVSLNE